MRQVRVPRARLAGWVERFLTRHGPLTEQPGPDHLRLVAVDGAVAEIAVPFLPWSPGPLPDLLAHLTRDRRLGVVLARRGGHAVGCFEGEQLIASKVGGSYVQGRTKAGGWSQQRYARRRANQATQARERAADHVAGVLLPHAARLDHLVLGGDRSQVEQVLTDPVLRPLADLPREPEVRATADPRLAVLQAFDPTGVTVSLNELA